MTEMREIGLLKDEIIKAMSVLERMERFYRGFIAGINPEEDRKTEQAIVIADIFCNYYTCLETAFLRISQFFENSLSSDRWHADLLSKMTLRIEDVREQVVSDVTYRILLEFMKFRHFKRYYFELEYDWDKIEFLQRKFDQLVPLVEKDMQAFLAFLDKLRSE